MSPDMRISISIRPSSLIDCLDGEYASKRERGMPSTIHILFSTILTIMIHQIQFAQPEGVSNGLEARRMATKF